MHRLGISHVYCSPITHGRSGSLHGYDVVDQACISPELGGRGGFERFAAAAMALGMGLLLDQVPNHMGVFGADNTWWMDVLENGAASEYAAYFDIDWCPPNTALQRKLLVPVLADAYGHVLDGGDIQLVFDAATGVLMLQYREQRFPLVPGTYPGVLRCAVVRVRKRAACWNTWRTRLRLLLRVMPTRPNRLRGAHASGSCGPDWVSRSRPTAQLVAH